MKRLRRLAGWAALCGTVVLTGWVAAAGLAGLGSPGIENTRAPIEDSPATSVIARVDEPQATALGEDGVSVLGEDGVSVLGEDGVSVLVEGAASVPHMGSGGAALPDPRPMPLAAPRLASLNTPDPVRNAARPAVSSFEALDACLEPHVCIDQYLWSLYERTPKVDTVKVTEQIKVTVEKKGKTRTVVKTLTKYVTEDFAWKDPIAAQKAGMSLKDYVIGGMDRGFKRKLYHALRAMDDAGLSPGITSAFRDDYRQGIATGIKASSDSSYHGGSRRGGYGHGLAADLVSVNGETRAERGKSSEILWKWIDAHEKELGIGRPYLDRDPPHVAPIDGKEYAAKRGRAKTQAAGLAKNRRPALAAKDNRGMTKSANAASR
jgi:hypothetical protein